MPRQLLVCDLDNTLYDWVGYYVPAFYRMVDVVVDLTNCDREELLNDFRTVHRLHNDSEHPFALLETHTIKCLYKGWSARQIAKELDPAFHAFNEARIEKLRLYPGVIDGLDALSAAGITLVAHTESKLFAVMDRLSRLNISHYFKKIYCRERSTTEHPDKATADRWLSRFPLHKVTELSHHQRKPSPAVLMEICRNEGILPRDAAYVGDSIARDILMAKDAGVCSVWAKYGAFHPDDQYQKLVRVTHWTEEDVAREKDLKKKAEGIIPDYVLKVRFDEIVKAMCGSAAAIKQ